VLTRRTIPLTLALLTGIVGTTAAQRKAVPPPEEVARAVLRADSAGDWATVLALAHPEALTRFRARQVFQLRMLGAQGWPDSDSTSTDSAASADSTAEAHWREVRARQEHFMLDSVFQVPSADSLSRTSPDTVYARWVRGIRARSRADSTQGYHVVGAVKASDTLAYVVMERRLEQPLGPLPEMFRDLPRETHMAVVMVMRRYGREWRSMLDGVGESLAFGPELLYDE
jgi:hypothetical protein